MMPSKSTAWIFIVICLLCLTSCNQPSANAETILIDGSSTVFQITTKTATRYQREPNVDVNIQVDISGTSGGFEKFCAGETDISDASRVISTEEMAACAEAGVEFIELPIALDALAVVVNAKNKAMRDMTLEELKTLWEPTAEGSITRWNQIRSSWPDQPITLFGPGSDSGTFDYFTEVIVGERGASRTDFTASEDDTELVDGLIAEQYGLAYFGLGYYAANYETLTSMGIDSGQGPIQPTVDAVRNFEYYPLTRPLFIYVNKASLSEKKFLRPFVNFYIQESHKWIPFIGYITLSSDSYDLVAQRFADEVTGSLYDGKIRLDVSVEELLKTSN